MEWNGDDVIGMGVNGGSVYDGYAVRNTNNLKLYIKNAGDFEKLTAQAAQLDENALMLRYLRGRMKLNDGVVEPLFRERFGQELPQEFSTLLDKAVENRPGPAHGRRLDAHPGRAVPGRSAVKHGPKNGSCLTEEGGSCFLCSKSPTACRFVVYW